MPAHLRFAVRQLAKAPGFTAIAVLTLALGIGSAATVFTAVNALLLRPLPLIQDQDRLLSINEAVPAKEVASTDISLADFLAWRERRKTLSALWIYETRTVIITGRTEPRRKNGVALSAGAFQAMGVQPILGRNLRQEEDRPGAPPVVLLSYALWKSEFGQAADIVGQTVKLNEIATTIVGVMPEGWRYPNQADLWVPLQADPAGAHHGSFHYSGHAMLKPGVTLDEARAEFAGISAALAQEFPATNDGLVAVLRPVREEATEDATHLALLLLGAVLFVFLIACANVANLLLARSSGRTKEIAIRLALGAKRRQLLGQLLTESLLLSVLGGIGGLILALWGIDLMLTAIPIELPFWVRFELDPRVFAFTGLLCLLGSAIFGLLPAWQASRPEVMAEMKESGRTSASGSGSHRLRNGLVVAEIALALVLLVGAGLMLRSFFLLHQANPGFETEGVLTFRVGFPAALTEDPQVVRRFFRELIARLSALPGVQSASAVSALPGIGLGNYQGVVLEGEPVPASLTATQTALSRAVSPGYFRTLGIGLVSGRDFSADDDEHHPAVAIVDQAFARLHFPRQNPIGRRFRALSKPHDPPEWLDVVGVVGTTRRYLDREEKEGTFYRPHAQEPSPFMSIALRVSGNPAAFVTPARAEVLAVNKNLPIYYEMSLARAISRSESVWLRRFFGSLFTLFAGIALLLASIGIYGVMAYAVAQRTQEIGVRMALGAQPRDVIRMVVRQGVGLVATGLLLGFAAAWALAQVLAGNLYGVSPHDPPTFAAVPLLLAGVALLACYVPSRRATLIDPIIALRGV